MDTGTLLTIIATGIAVVTISYGLDHIWAAALPARSVYLALRAPGIILHECSHIIGCILTGARVRKVVLLSGEGGSVTYSRPAIPLIGDVIISTAPLFLIPLTLAGITWFFAQYLGCSFPPLPPDTWTPEVFLQAGFTLPAIFSDNLLTRFNGWFLLYLLLALSLVLSLAPSTQDMKNAAAGSLLLVLAGTAIAWTGIPWAVMVLDRILLLIGYGLLLGLVYGLVALATSLPLVLAYLYRRQN